MYHCASTFLQKMYKTKVKTIFGDCPVVEQALVRVWLLATVDKMQFSLEKNRPHVFVIHMHNLPKQRETRRVTQKTPLKKSLYIRCSYS